MKTAVQLPFVKKNVTYSWIDRTRNLLISVLLICYITEYFFNNPRLELLVGIITIVVILLSLPSTKGAPLVFGTIMFVTGTVILLAQEDFINNWLGSITTNLPLVCIILLVPILSIPIKLGGYQSKMAKLATSYSDKPSLLYFSISSIYFLLGPVINVGSVRVIHGMIKEMKFPAAFLGRVHVRGFTPMIAWSPYFASVFFVMLHTGVSITEFLPYGLMLGTIQFILGNLAFIIYERKSINFPESSSKQIKIPRKIVELTLVFILLTGMIFLFEHLFAVNTSIIVSLTVVGFAAMWSLLLGKAKEFGNDVNNMRAHFLPDRSNEIILFLTSGFFGVVIGATPIGSVLETFIAHISEFPVFVFSLIIISLIGGLALIGIHQIVTATAILSAITMDELSITNLLFAMVLLSGWSVATIVSPVTPVNVIVSNLLKTRIFHIVLRWNLLFAVIVTIVDALLIQLIALF